MGVAAGFRNLDVMRERKNGDNGKCKIEDSGAGRGRNQECVISRVGSPAGSGLPGTG